jgi:pyridoxal phosphate enzyme (YggS family)
MDASVDAATIDANIDVVRSRIADAARRSGRDPDDITLVAVTKTVDPARIQAAADTGIRDFGENYYQEARDKLPLFGSEIRWHFIGHLQSNKAKYIAGRFDLIHSVDSLNLAAEIGKRASNRGLIQEVLIEVKLAESDAKHGVEPERTLDLAGDIAQTAGVRLRGLMGMAAFGGGSEDSRPYFARLRGLFDQLPPVNRVVLSMGMTGDFEVAIEEGATLVRIGTAIFGVRNQEL